MRGRRLLIIAYHFVPEPAAGAQRPFYLARELGERGWDVTVLTREARSSPSFSEFGIARVGTPVVDPVTRNGTPSRGYNWVPRPIMGAVREVLFFPDRTAPWSLTAAREALALTRAQAYDVILSTSPPTSVHLAASWCSARRNLPWIADYRDLWSGNPYVEESPLRRRVQRYVELRTMKHADAVTAATPAIASSLRDFLGRPVDVIMNVFDPKEWTAIPHMIPTSFELVFTGTLHGGKRRPDMLFEAIARLRAAGEAAGLEATVHFYGTNQGRLLQKAQRYGLGNQVIDHGSVTRQEAMHAQRASAVLLILLSEDPATTQEYTSKLFEYAGAGRPILALGPASSVVKEFMATHRLGEFASNAAEAMLALRRLYAGFRTGDLVKAHALPSSPSTLADSFSNVIESAISRHRAKS